MSFVHKHSYYDLKFKRNIIKYDLYWFLHFSPSDSGVRSSIFYYSSSSVISHGSISGSGGGGGSSIVKSH